jgi:hypothetical protein
MNNQEKYNEDLLRQYITPEKIEKAPEGFTSKVMAGIRLEKIPVMVHERSRKKNFVPVIYSAVALLLVVVAFLIPESQSDSLALPFLKLIKILKFSMPETNLSSIFHLTLPSIIMYACIGILVLTIFDRALYEAFHKEKE